jgi:beta-fructofuranosidase
VMTLPRVLSLDDEGGLCIDPPAELEALRGEGQRIESLSLDADAELVLRGIAGDVMELSIVAELSEGATLGVVVRRSAAEGTVIAVDAATGTLAIDTTRSTLRDDIFQRHPIARGDVPQSDVRVQVAPLTLVPGEPLTLRIYLDRSMLEVFANRRQCVTQRIYPTREDSVGVALFARGGSAVIRSVEAWPLAPVNLG